MPPSYEQVVTASPESDAQIAHLEETRNVPPACGDGTESSAAMDGRPLLRPPRPSAGGDDGAAATRPLEQRERNVQNWPAQDAGNGEAPESSQTNGRWPNQRQPNPHHPRRQHLLHHRFFPCLRFFFSSSSLFLFFLFGSLILRFFFCFFVPHTYIHIFIKKVFLASHFPDPNSEKKEVKKHNYISLYIP